MDETVTGETLKLTLVVIMQVLLFLLASCLFLAHVDLEEAHNAQYTYMQEEIKKQNQELEELRKELRNNNIIVQKVMEKEW